MVFLDQDGVPQRQAVIAAATGPDCVFLGDAQAGQGLAGIDDLRLGTGDGVGVGADLAGDGGKQLQEVEGAALGGEQGAAVAFDFAQQLVGGDAVTIGAVPGDRGGRVAAAHAFVEPGRATQYARLAADHRGLDQPFAGNQAGGQVAGADILGQGSGDVAVDFFGQRVVECDAHG